MKREEETFFISFAFKYLTSCGAQQMHEFEHQLITSRSNTDVTFTNHYRTNFRQFHSQSWNSDTSFKETFEETNATNVALCQKNVFNQTKSVERKTTNQKALSKRDIWHKLWYKAKSFQQSYCTKFCNVLKRASKTRIKPIRKIFEMNPYFTRKFNFRIILININMLWT